MLDIITKSTISINLALLLVIFFIHALAGFRPDRLTDTAKKLILLLVCAIITVIFIYTNSWVWLA